MASFRSIFALKPPLTHCSAAFFPPNKPLRTSERPAIAAAMAPTPMMIGVDIVWKGVEGEWWSKCKHQAPGSAR